MIFQKKPEFHLENAIKKSMEFPRTFLIPSKNEIENLSIGDLIKLIFVINIPRRDGCRAEKMWVKITHKHGEIFTGILDNEPHYLKSVKCGDTVTFMVKNIAGIYGGKAAFNEKLFAIITKKALNEKQINWAVRTNDLNNAQDSGWQLFYGDENEQYLNDAHSAQIISLEDALSFEPLLESAFAGSGQYYEYSKIHNQFVEVNA